MNRVLPLILTLWGKGFDEIVAATFVGELRRLGARVKTVGFNMQQTTGRHGLALQPDLTLDRALSLAQYTSCVMIPGTIEDLQQFGYDPRLAELLQRAAAADTLLVVGQSDSLLSTPPAHHINTPQHHNLHQLLAAALTYPDGQAIGTFIHSVLVPQLDLRGIAI